MIQAAVLPVEEISLIDKSFLYKDIVFENQLKEKLLLKLDNELSAAEIAKVNSILATNPSAKATYDLLEKTKLDANEKIIFEEKHLLYKKEKDNVVVFGFLRWAAAAVLVGIALFTGVKIYNSKKDTSGTIASNNGKTNKLDSNKIAKTSNGIKTDTNAVYKNALNGEISNSTKLVENNPSDYNVEIKNGKSKKEIENNITNKNSSKNFVTNSVNQRLTDTNKTTKELPLIENKFIAKEDAIIPKIENKIKEAIIENKNTIAVNSKASKNEITQSFKELEETYSKTATAYTEDKILLIYLQ